MQINNRVRFELKELEGKVDVEELKALCTYENPSYAMALRRAQGKYRPKGVSPVIFSWEETLQHVSFPRGVLRQERFLEAIAPVWKPGFPYLDLRSTGDDELRRAFPRLKRQSGFEARDFQRQLVETGVTPSPGDLYDALWKSPPGSGKTETALMYIERVKLPALVTVPSIEVLNEWVRRCKKRYGYEPGVIQGKERYPRPITIAMQQTLKNCMDEYAHMFGVLVNDEAQRDGADTFFEVADQSWAKYRLGITADERRADGKHFLVYDVLGPVSCEIKRERLVDEGFIIESEIRVVPTEFKPEWYLKLQPEKRQFHTTRLMQQMYENEERNELILRYLLECRGHRTMAMSMRVEHCRMLDSLATGRGHKCGLFLGGKDYKEEFDSCFKRMHSGALDVAFATYQAVGVGFDLPGIDRGMFVMPCANSAKAQMQFNQYRGRYERISFETGKANSVIYYFWDRHVYGTHVVANLKKWCKNVVVWNGHDWIPAKEFLNATRKTSSRAERKPELRVEGFAELEPPKPIFDRARTSARRGLTRTRR